MRSAIVSLMFFCAACSFPLFHPGDALCFDGTLRIGTGSKQGVYYAVGRSLAKIANQYDMMSKIKFAAVSSGGSVDNINGLQNGRFHFIIAQADKVYEAWNGKGPWAKAGKQKKLRAVANLYKESITLVVGENTGIKKLEDIKGKNISLGKEGSGTRANVMDLFKIRSINVSQLGKAQALGPHESAKLLVSGRLDGFFYTVGHPWPLLQKLTKGNRKLRFVGLPFSKQMSKVFPYYVASWIPLDQYPKAANVGAEVRTCGVMACLLVSEDVPMPWVYRFVHAIAFHCKEFKKSHPVLRKLDQASFGGKNWKISVPYHAGAKKFFLELGEAVKK